MSFTLKQIDDAVVEKTFQEVVLEDRCVLCQQSPSDIRHDAIDAQSNTPLQFCGRDKIALKIQDEIGQDNWLTACKIADAILNSMNENPSKYIQVVR